MPLAVLYDEPISLQRWQYSVFDRTNFTVLSKIGYFYLNNFNVYDIFVTWNYDMSV